jgi:hypothetical protein
MEREKIRAISSRSDDTASWRENQVESILRCCRILDETGDVLLVGFEAEEKRDELMESGCCFSVMIEAHHHTGT